MKDLIERLKRLNEAGGSMSKWDRWYEKHVSPIVDIGADHGYDGPIDWNGQKMSMEPPPKGALFVGPDLDGLMQALKKAGLNAKQNRKTVWVTVKARKPPE